MRFTTLHDGVNLLKHTESDNQKERAIELKAKEVYLFFSLDGQVSFQFGPMYMRPLPANESFFIYNPSKTLTAHMQMPKGNRLIGVELSISKMHRLFMPDGETVEELPFLGNEELQRPVYDQKTIGSNAQVILEDLFQAKLSPNAQRIANYGQVLQLLGLHFHKSQPDLATCPFLRDEDTMRRIHDAKNIIIERWQSPPTIKEIAAEVGLNEYRLKAGFKEVYGNTVYGYVMDTRLNHARRLLVGRQHTVNEIAFEIGYHNPSHFIAAFKKKFGTTPKRYLTNPS